MHGLTYVPKFVFCLMCILCSTAQGGTIYFSLPYSEASLQ